MAVRWPSREVNSARTAARMPSFTATNNRLFVQVRSLNLCVPTTSARNTGLGDDHVKKSHCRPTKHSVLYLGGILISAVLLGQAFSDLSDGRAQPSMRGVRVHSWMPDHRVLKSADCGGNFE